MTIHKAQASGYNDVQPQWIVQYIKQYADWINQTVNPDGVDKTNTKLTQSSKTQLKSIAAELETVQKRLKYILEGVY